jgi:hypothetical protein
VAPADGCLVDGKLAVSEGISRKFSVRGRSGVKVRPDPGYEDVDEFGVSVAGFSAFAGGLDEG